ncbi:MAG TPA: hypothetical protein VF881_21205, partial [Polyangiaceae bacterium]
MFWRGGTVLAAIIFANLVGLAFWVAEVYESEATVEWVGAREPAELAERLRAAILQPLRLEQFVRQLTPGLQDADVAETVLRARNSIDFRPRGERQFNVVFRASTALAAQRACDQLTKIDWEAVVATVIDAQALGSERDEAAGRPTLRLVQEASLPSKPIKPNRPLFGLVGLTAGLWMGVLWAFARVALGHDAVTLRRRRRLEEVTDGVESLRGDYSATSRERHTSEPPGSSGEREAFWQGPMKLRATQPGVIDVAKVLAHTGAVPEGSRPISARPIVDVGHRDVGSAGAGSFGEPEVPVIDRRQPNPHPFAQSTADGPPGFGSEARRSFERPRHPASKTYSFASPEPVQPPNPPRAGNTVVGASDRAPAQAPAGSSLVMRSKPPDEVFSLRNVASGWSAHASLAQGESLRELRTIRDQIYRLSVSGCLIVGVSSTPEAAGGKPRIAGQLASLLAEPGRARVLFMEADFDRPAVHRMMRIDMPFSLGFSEQMRQRMKASNTQPWTLVRCLPKLHVLAEGLVRSPGLLPSVQFVDALTELRPYYDVIVVHGPIAGTSVDTRALDQLCDGIVLVGSKDSTPSEVL